MAAIKRRKQVLRSGKCVSEEDLAKALEASGGIQTTAAATTFNRYYFVLFRIISGPSYTILGSLSFLYGVPFDLRTSPGTPTSIASPGGEGLFMSLAGANCPGPPGPVSVGGAGNCPGSDGGKGYYIDHYTENRSLPL